MNLKELNAVFDSIDIEWRIGRAGKKNGRIWATVLAYVTNRAIMERLDRVVGPENWQNKFVEGPGGGILCGIGIRTGDGWVWKWDGAENTEIESVKGGLSGSMKRAGVQWGIGRYLYRLDEGFAKVHDNGANYGRLPQKEGGDSFHWDPPALPAWAIPGGTDMSNDEQLAHIRALIGKKKMTAKQYKGMVEKLGGQMTQSEADGYQSWLEALPDITEEKSAA